MNETGWEFQMDRATWRGEVQRPDGTENILTATVWHVSDREELLDEIRRAEHPGWTTPGAELFRPGLHLRLECNGDLAMLMDMNLRPEMNLDEFTRTVPAREYVTGTLEQLMPGEFNQPGPAPGSAVILHEGDVVSYADMGGWPMTPGLDRFMEAVRLLENEVGGDSPGPPPGERELLDLRAMREMVTTDVFEKMAASALKERAGSAASPIGVAQILGWMGDTGLSIGLVASLNWNQDGLNMSQISMSRLLRDPDWMGMSRVLPRLRGTNAVLMESRDLPGRPGMVLATTDDLDDLDDTDGNTAEPLHGEVVRLRGLLEWHGVRSSVWIPSAENPEPRG